MASIASDSETQSSVPFSQGDSTLAGLVQMWAEKIKRAKDYKEKVFQRDANEAMKYYAPPEGGYSFVYSSDLHGSRYGDFDNTEPQMRMTLNKVAELVEIFGPTLYQQNPIRQVNPRDNVQIPPSSIPDPVLFQYLMEVEQNRQQADALKCNLLSAYLNWTPSELKLEEHSRKAIIEAIIKGRGLLWCATWTPPGSNTTYVGSFYDTVDFLQIDPDAEDVNNAWWISREVCQPIWQAERRFGLKKGSLKGNIESVNQQAEVDAKDAEYHRKRGITNDLITYHEIYSRMGVGGRLSGNNFTDDKTGDSNVTDLVHGDLDTFSRVIDPLVGDHVYLCIAKGTPYPLNLPPEIQELPVTGTGDLEDGGPVIKERLSWPVPFWEDGSWPVSMLDFHTIPRQAWPMSHVQPALGELRFLCWAYSFMACKIKNTLRDVVAVLKEMADNFKQQILEGADLTCVELDTNNRDIRECVQILQFPPMNADIWKIVQAVEANFDKRVGLNEVMYGGGGPQTRSATASQGQQQGASIRPQDMKERVESWMTSASRKEAIAARMLLAPKDVLPRLGLTAAALWGTYLSTRDMGVIRQLEYRIEAGSTQKPNRDRDKANADSAFQILGPIFTQFASATGQLGPINALIGLWCKTRDVPPGPFQLPLPPPPPPPGAPVGPPAHGAPPGQPQPHGSAPPPPGHGPPPPR